MRKHDRYNKFKRKWERGLLKTAILLVLLVGVILLTTLAFPNESIADLPYWQRLVVLFTSDEAVSVFVTALGSALVIFVVDLVRNRNEEYFKLNDDKRGIAHHYETHMKITEATPKKQFDMVGANLYIRKTCDDKPRRNPFHDKFSAEYKHYEQDKKDYAESRLVLPNVSLYTNIGGKVDVTIEDSNHRYELPEFLVNCATDLIAAHKHSSARNNTTIRLDNVRYDAQADRLTLCTGRSTYYQMLLTNRCMDYSLERGITVREVYEYGKQISPLGESSMCNQIGINGLIITQDGYLLIEKRSHLKTTWKNKFAQPISLAMKEADIASLLYDRYDANGQPNANAGVLREECQNQVFGRIVQSTVLKNFGITCDMYTFDMSTNFLGVARDLVEGGKPNLYFYIVVNLTAKELRKHIQEFSARDSKREVGNQTTKPLTSDKLDSDYYLVRYADMYVDFDYALNIKYKNTLWVRRALRPRATGLYVLWDIASHFAGYSSRFKYRREVGDALLGCLAYLESAHDRIPQVCNVEIAKKHTNERIVAIGENYE